MRSRGQQHWLRVFAWAVAALALLGQPASAFYWYGWPGSGIPDPPRIVTITEEPPPIVELPPEPPNPNKVPEPATLLAAVVGLATVAVARRRKSAQRRSP